jgi:hypothetical protein
MDFAKTLYIEWLKVTHLRYSYEQRGMPLRRDTYGLPKVEV